MQSDEPQTPTTAQNSTIEEPSAQASTAESAWTVLDPSQVLPSRSASLVLANMIPDITVPRDAMPKESEEAVNDGSATAGLDGEGGEKAIAGEDKLSDVASSVASRPDLTKRTVSFPAPGYASSSAGHHRSASASSAYHKSLIAEFPLIPFPSPSASSIPFRNVEQPSHLPFPKIKSQSTVKSSSSVPQAESSLAASAHSPVKDPYSVSQTSLLLAESPRARHYRTREKRTDSTADIYLSHPPPSKAKVRSSQAVEGGSGSGTSESDGIVGNVIVRFGTQEGEQEINIGRFNGPPRRSSSARLPHHAPQSKFSSIRSSIRNRFTRSAPQSGTLPMITQTPVITSANNSEQPAAMNPTQVAPRDSSSSHPSGYAIHRSASEQEYLNIVASAAAASLILETSTTSVQAPTPQLSIVATLDPPMYPPSTTHNTHTRSEGSPVIPTISNKDPATAAAKPLTIELAEIRCYMEDVRSPLAKLAMKAVGKGVKKDAGHLPPMRGVGIGGGVPAVVPGKSEGKIRKERKVDGGKSDGATQKMGSTFSLRGKIFRVFSNAGPKQNH